MPTSRKRKYENQELADIAKKQQDAKRQKLLSKVRFCGQDIVRRWNALKDTLSLDKHAEMAAYLLDV